MMKIYWKEISKDNWMLLAEPASKILNLLKSTRSHRYRASALGRQHGFFSNTEIEAKEIAKKWMIEILNELKEALQ